jgi:hypothetical protein
MDLLAVPEMKVEALSVRVVVSRYASRVASAHKSPQAAPAAAVSTAVAPTSIRKWMLSLISFSSDEEKSFQPPIAEARLHHRLRSI